MLNNETVRDTLLVDDVSLLFAPESQRQWVSSSKEKMWRRWSGRRRRRTF